MQAFDVRTDEARVNPSCACGCGEPVTKPGNKWLKGHSQRGKMLGSLTWNWKGDDIAYRGVHKWVARHKERTGVCQHCGRRPKPTPGGRKKNVTSFANISGEYRRDLDDYIELCEICHKSFDRKVK